MKRKTNNKMLSTEVYQKRRGANHVIISRVLLHYTKTCITHKDLGYTAGFLKYQKYNQIEIAVILITTTNSYLLPPNASFCVNKKIKKTFNERERD